MGKPKYFFALRDEGDLVATIPVSSIMRRTVAANASPASATTASALAVSPVAASPIGALANVHNGR